MFFYCIVTEDDECIHREREREREEEGEGERGGRRGREREREGGCKLNLFDALSLFLCLRV